MTIKNLVLSFCAAIALAAPAQAACYAEYRAQRQNPVQLAFGVAQITGGSCSAQAAQSQISSALARSGWTLTNIVSTMNTNNQPANTGYTSGHYLRY